MFAQLKWNLLIILIAAIIIAFFQMQLHTVTAERNAARLQINVLSNQIRDQDTAITQWQQQALAQQKRLNIVEQQISQQSATIQNNSQKILSQKVSPECHSAVRWGAMQANKLASAW